MSKKLYKIICLIEIGTQKYHTHLSTAKPTRPWSKFTASGVSKFDSHGLS